MLDAEADRLYNEERYERTESRRDTRAGHYDRQLGTKTAEVTLKAPKLRRQTVEAAIIKRYRRREASVKETLIEMHHVGRTLTSCATAKILSNVSSHLGATYFRRMCSSRSRTALGSTK